MLNLNKITLLTIDGAGKYGNKLKNLFDICSREITFFEKKILTSDTNFTSYDDVNVVHVDPMTYDDYNKFCVQGLSKHVNSDYVLLVQNDGFISNPDKWTDEFLNYDYIGAPWQNEENPDAFPWTEGGTKNMVGCGGFSLRSKKLIDICSKYSEHFVKNQVLAGMHEDIFVCVYARPYLEEQGCKFSSVELANQFARGSKPCEKNITKISFGFHESTGYLQDALECFNEKYSTNYTVNDLY